METVYEINRDQARLSGKLRYGGPPFLWTLNVADGWMKIIPDEKGMRGVIWYFVLLAGVSIPSLGYLGLKHFGFGVSRWVLVAMTFGPAIALAVVAVGLHACLVHARRAGPWFSFNAGDDIFRLPRIGRSVHKEQVVRWELVSGTWVRGEGGLPTRFGDHITELQLVFRDNDKLLATPVIGALGVHGIDDVAAAISEFTKTKLEQLDMGRRFRTQGDCWEAQKKGHWTMIQINGHRVDNAKGRESDQDAAAGGQ